MPTNNEMMRTLEHVQKKKRSGKAFLQGVISMSYVLVSILVVFFIYVPYISGVNDIIKSREELEKEVSLLQTKYDHMNGYDRTKLRSELTLVSHYIPDDMKVAQLATFVNDQASEFDLTVSRLGITEQKTEVSSTTADEKEKLIGSKRDVTSVYLGKIEGPFSFLGERKNIFEFLDFLVLGGYATTFNDVTVSAIDSAQWQVSFSTSYYYLNPLVGVDPKTPEVSIDSNVFEPLAGYNIDSNANEDITVPNEITVSPSPTEELVVTPTVTDEGIETTPTPTVEQ